jgi:hypothetical protein
VPTPMRRVTSALTGTVAGAKTAIGALLLATVIVPLAACGSSGTNAAGGGTNATDGGANASSGGTNGASGSSPVDGYSPSSPSSPNDLGSWTPGGAWAIADPPPDNPAGVDFPSPIATTVGASFTTPGDAVYAAGQKYSFSITLGVPLQSQIPDGVYSCEQDDGNSQNLPQDQYVVPIALNIGDLVGEQEEALVPQVTVTLPGSAQPIMTATSELGYWAGGECGPVTLNPGTTALFGIIGATNPFTQQGQGMTVAELKTATISAEWSTPGGDATAMSTRSLMSMLPPQAQSWLQSQS